MDIEKLKYFVKVAELEHLTQAADDLHITQPALSRIISQIEGELGVKLFDRQGRTLKLNDNGRIVYNSTVRILDEIKTMKEQISDLSEGRHGQITFVTSFPNRESDWISDAILKYTSSHSEVKFYQIQESTASIREHLENRSIDVALTDRPMTGSNINWEQIYTERMGVIMSVDHPLAKQPIIDLNELKNEAFYSNDDRSNDADITSFVCNMAGFSPNIVFRGDYPTMISRAVGERRGVSIVTEGAYLLGFGRKNKNEDTWNPKITFKPIRNEFCRRTYGLVTLKERYLPKVVQDFYDQLLHYDIEAYRKRLWASMNEEKKG